MASLHSNRGAKRAREARERLGIPAEPLDVLDTVEASAGVFLQAFDDDRFAGALVRRDGRDLVVANWAQPKVRLRFTLAHELGHVRCGHGEDAIVDTVETLAGANTTSTEVQANAFAAELLVPRAALEAATAGPGLDEIVRIASRFGVSAIVVVFRFNTLGLLSEQRLLRLRAEIAADEHRLLHEHLGLEPLDDRIQRLTDADVPWVSDSLEDSVLAARARAQRSSRQV